MCGILQVCNQMELTMPKGGEHTSKYNIMAMPVEIFFVISEFLTVNEFLSFTYVSKEIKTQAESVPNTFWQKAFKRHFPQFEQLGSKVLALMQEDAKIVSDPDHINWLELFKFVEKTELSEYATQIKKISRDYDMDLPGDVSKLSSAFRDAKDLVPSSRLPGFPSIVSSFMIFNLKANLFTFNAKLFLSSRDAYLDYMFPFYKKIANEFIDSNLNYFAELDDAEWRLSFPGYDLDLPNSVDSLGHTQLMLAAKNRNLSAIIALIKAGAAIDVQNNDGETVFDFIKNDNDICGKMNDFLNSYLHHFIKNINFCMMFFYAYTGQYSFYSIIQKKAWADKGLIWPDQASPQGGIVVDHKPIKHLLNKNYFSPLETYPRVLRWKKEDHRAALMQEFEFITSSEWYNSVNMPLHKFVYGIDSKIINYQDLCASADGFNEKLQFFLFRRLTSFNLEFVIEKINIVKSIFKKIDTKQFYKRILDFRKNSMLSNLISNIPANDIQVLADIADEYKYHEVFTLISKPASKNRSNKRSLSGNKVNSCPKRSK